MARVLHRRHRLLVSVLLAYLVALALVVFWPAPVDRGSGHFLVSALAWLHGHGMPRWFSYQLVEWLSNVVMFLPFGFLVASIREWGSWAWPALIGLATSVAIETTQFLFLEQRTASLLDVAANTLGALLGIGFFVICERKPPKTR